MPSNQFFTDWVTNDLITAAKLNQMKNDVAALSGATFDANVNVIINGGNLRINSPVTGGGWARGCTFFDTAGSSEVGGFGLLGDGVTITYAYLGAIAAPYSDSKALRVYPNGNVLINGTTAWREENLSFATGFGSSDALTIAANTSRDYLVYTTSGRTTVLTADTTDLLMFWNEGVANNDVLPYLWRNTSTGEVNIRLRNLTGSTLAAAPYAQEFRVGKITL